MKLLEAHRVWTQSSTGGGKAYKPVREASLFTVYFTASAGCTATVQLQTCAGSSAGPWVGLGTSTTLSSNAGQVHQFSGPLEWVRPYVTAIAASSDVVTTTLLGI